MRISSKKMLIWGSLGFFVLTGLLLILPWFLNPEYLERLVLQQIQQTFGAHVRVGRTSFALFPSPHFLVSDIIVKERDDSHAVFRAQSMTLELGVGQLFQKKLVVREFFLDYPEIEIHRDKSGVWRFLGHSSPDSAVSSLAAFLVLGKLVVTNGKIIVIDESPTDTVRGVVLENVSCLSETSDEDTVVRSALTLSGNLRQLHDTAPFRLTGTLESSLSTPVSLLKQSNVVFKQMTFLGHIETDNFAINQLADYLPHGEVLLTFPGKLHAESMIQWTRNEKTSHLTLSKIALANSALSLEGHASLEGLEDGHHMASVSMQSSPFNLQGIRSLIPDSWLPADAVALKERAEWGGELEVLEARVTGSTRPDIETSVTGTFRVHHGFLHSPDLPKTDQVEGLVVVEPDRVKVTEAHGLYDGISVEVTQGLFLFKEGGSWGEVEIQGIVPAPKIWNVVTHLGHGPTGSTILPAWKVSAGTGLLRLRFAGHVFDEQGLMFQDGDYQPQDVVATIPMLPHALSNGQGKIQFSPDSTVFEEIQGTVGGHPLTMNGTILHQRTLRLEPMTVSLTLEGQEIFAEPGQDGPPSGFQLRGPLHVSVTMRGPLRRLKVKGKIDGQEARVGFPSVIQKEPGQPGVLEFDGEVRPRGIIQFERLELAMLPLRLRGQGLLRWGRSWGFDGRLNSGPISVGLLPDKIRILGDAIESGILEIQLEGSGVGPDWRKWDLNGWVALTEGVVRLPEVQAPLTHLYVRLKIEKHLLDLKRMEFRLNESTAVVTGLMKNWSTTPEASLMWNAPQFDLDLLIPKNERSFLRDGVEWLADHGTLEGSILIEHPIYKAFSGEKLSAVLSIHDNLLAMDKIHTTIEDDGNLAGRVFIHLPPGKPAAMRASFEGTHLPFEKLLRVLGDERRFVSGNLNIQGKIQGDGRDGGGVIPTLKGGVQLSLDDGYVRKGTILPKILRILNFPHVLREKARFEKTGFPFDSITATLDIEDGKFLTKDFLLRSSLMNVTAAGTYDLRHDYLDGVAAVSPFGAYSDALKAIPLFEEILTGDQQGIATAMFSMIGPLAEPQIVYMPRESFKAGLTGLAQLAFDLLKNSVSKPVDALKGGAKATTPSLSSTSRFNRAILPE